MSDNLKLALIALALLIMAPFIILFRSVTPEPKQISQAEKDAGILRIACRDEISRALHDPSSAEWGIGNDGWFQTWPVSDDGNNLTATATFRAKNAFGALVNARYQCSAVRIDGMLSLTSIKKR
jgi:hypothetical protein